MKLIRKFTIAPLLLSLAPLALAADTAPASSQSDFTSKVFQVLAEKKGNLNFSPLSLKMALELVYWGSNGETRSYFEKTFGFKDQNKEAFSKELALIKSSPEMTLKIADSVWYRDPNTFQPAYLNRLNQEKIDAAPIDVGALNTWVSRETNGMIPKLLDGIPALMKTIFVNALYFKADWVVPFDKRFTSNETFHTDAKTGKSVPMMHQTANFNYNEDEQVQTLEMSYRSSPFEMVLILPKKRYGLAEIGKKTGLSEILKLAEAGQSQKVILTLPKFKFETKAFMGDALTKAGYGKLFQGGDYSKLYKSDGQHINDILQATQIIVDEKGTEAAAATAVMMKSSAVMLTKKIVFQADQPFLFVLKNRETGEIYFLGRVEKP